MHSGVHRSILAQRCALRQLFFHTAVHIMSRMAKRVVKKDPSAVALGRKGGKNSRVNLTPEQRTELAKKAARARWGEPKRGKPRKNPGETIKPT